MQEKVVVFFNSFIQSLTIYDYLGFALLGLLFLLLIILAILMRSRTAIVLFFTFVAFMLVTAGPFGVKYGFDHLVRSSEVTVDKAQKLQYSSALLVEGKITNTGKIDYSKCEIGFKVVQPADNKALALLHWLRPIAYSHLVVDKKLQRGQSEGFEHMIDGFTYEDAFEIKTIRKCYP